MTDDLTFYTALGRVMVSISEDQGTNENKPVVKEEIMSYEAKCSLTIPIAKPLATRKLSKKLYKCCKLAIKVSNLWFMSGHQAQPS
jgi:hypothetical protein